MGRLKCQMALNLQFLLAAAALCNIGQVSCQLQGCAFEVPQGLKAPVTTPLVLDVDILIVGLRDVASSGGSFGVDLEYVSFYFLTSVYAQFNPCLQDFPGMGRLQVCGAKGKWKWHLQ